MNERFLILVGTTRGGSTALYKYLEPHPDVAVTYPKEVGFFLDDDLKFLQPAAFRNSNDLKEYLSFFRPKQNSPKIYFDASPNYLYSPGAAKKIKEMIPNALILMVLRDPVERFISWFKYAKQQSLIPQDMTMEGFFDRQSDSGATSRESFVYQALDQGRYSKYLVQYLDAFPKEQILISFFEELEYEPREYLSKLCQFAGIDFGPYKDFKFEKINSSLNIRFPLIHALYIKSGRVLRKRLARHKRVYRFIQRAKRTFDRWYFRHNVSVKNDDNIAPETPNQIRTYYQKEVSSLKSLGIVPRWKNLPR
jgi:hypothetical protein